MSTFLQPGRHPDAEELSAFAEHALPAHEQQATLAHLADCEECRAAVFLARQSGAQEDAAAEGARARGDLMGWVRLEDWLSGWRLALPALGLACLLLLTLHLRKATVPGGQTVPMGTASNGQVQAPPPGDATRTSKPGRAGERVRAKAGLAHRRKGLRPVVAQPVTTIAMATPTVATPPAPIALEALSAPPTLRIEPRSARRFATGVSEGGVEGTIVDAVGQAVARATVTATNTDTGVQETRATNAAGDYSIAPLEPGNYNVEVVAPGFKRLLQENVTVDATTIARLDQRLTRGGADTTVTITDAPPLLYAADATIGGSIENQLYAQLPISMNGGPRDPTAFQHLMPGVQENPANNTGAGANNGNSGIYGGTGQTNLNENYVAGVPGAAAAGENAGGVGVGVVDALSVSADAAGAAPVKPMTTLPSKLPALMVVGDAGLTLAIDAAGALFRSDDGGATWQPIRVQWQGRALTLRLTQPRTAARQAAKSTVNAAEAGQQASTPTSPAAAFELTTDSGAVYTSTDGQTWRVQ
jgi:hypothetical protein